MSLAKHSCRVVRHRSAQPVFSCVRALSTIPPYPSFPEYRAFKNSLLSSQDPGTKVTRLDCMKPATALEHYLQPVPLCRPPFAQSYDEVSSEFAKVLGSVTSLLPDNLVLTKGVRDGIFLALEALSSTPGHRNAVSLPLDVYPVYEHIVNKTAASAVTHKFQTLQGGSEATHSDPLDLPTLLANISHDESMDEDSVVNNVLLLPHPLTPQGRSFTPQEVALLDSWLTAPTPASSPRFLLLDCVYSFQLQTDAALLAPLLALPNVAALHSLAKGWLSPFLEPNVVSPHPSSASAPGPVARSHFSSGAGSLHTCSGAWRQLVRKQLAAKHTSLLPPHSSLLQALLTLKQQPRLPEVLWQRLRRQWLGLEPALKQIDPSFTAPVTGYFSTMRGRWDALYSQHGAVTVPTSVFGVPTPPPGQEAEGCSVVSCLYDIKDDDLAQGRSSSVSAFMLQESGPESDPCEPNKSHSVPMYHVTTLSNFIRGYDKYSRRYSKDNIPESTFSNQFFLLHAHQLPTGVEKASRLLRKLNIDGDALLVLHTDISTGNSDGGDGVGDDELVPHPKGQFLRRNWISVTDLSLLPSSPGSTLQGISVEEAASRSLHLLHPHLMPYQAVQPRSVSIMPIAKGCQAKCPFCFSKGSVSDDTKQQRMYEDKIDDVLRAAVARGAQRAVITGGGEPFMLPFPRMLKLIAQCSAKFSTVCAISNGYSLSQLSDQARLEALQALDAAGLTVLSLSRHAVTEDENEQIMWLRTESHKVAETWRVAMDRGELTSLTRLRWVCVLQKGGIDSHQKMHDYLSFAARSGANEVCFKELYVSTTVESVYHDHASNVWSAEHQVPLSLVLDFCESHGFVKTGELPWGAPIYEGEYAFEEGGVDGGSRWLKIAAYTEPSVFWERSQGVCRSWNYMASGEVLASLEDKDSQVDISTDLLASPRDI